MKKFFKVLGIILLVLAIIAAGLVIWQWKYVKALIDGIRYDEAALGEKNVQNAEQTISSVNEQISVPLREITPEEKEKIASGELSQTALMAQIISEAVGTPLEGEAAGEQGTAPEAGAETAQPAEQPTLSPEQTSKPEQTPAPTPTSDQLIAGAVNKLYELQSSYTSQLDNLVARAKAYYHEQKAQSGSAAAKSSTATKFSGEVASMENACDAKVEAVLSGLNADLNNIGADTAIISTLRTAYQNEKSIQRAAYVNKYMK